VPIVDAVAYRFKIRLKAPAMLPGVYTVRFTLRDRENYETHERIFNMNSFVIDGTASNRGIIECNAVWELAET
jgi:hypothetical protein